MAIPLEKQPALCYIIATHIIFIQFSNYKQAGPKQNSK